MKNCLSTPASVINNKIYFNTASPVATMPALNNQYAITVSGNFDASGSAKVACNKLWNPTPGTSTYNNYYKRGIAVVNNFVNGSSSASTLDVNTFGFCPPNTASGTGLIAGNEFDNYPSTANTGNGARLDMYLESVNPDYYYNLWGTSPSQSKYKPLSISGSLNLAICPISAIGYNNNQDFCLNNNNLPAVSAQSVFNFNTAYSPANLLPSSSIPALRTIAAILFDMQQTSDAIVLQKLQDELFEVMRADGDDSDLIVYLQSLNSDEGLMELVRLYVGKEMGNEALQNLNMLTNQYNEINRTAFKEFYQILIDLLLQNRTVDEMTISEKEMMEAIKELNVESSGDAYNVLKEADEIPYTIPCEKMGDCDMDTTVTDSTVVARKATHKTTFQQFLDAQSKMNHERGLNNSKGISTVQTIYKQGLSVVPNPAQEYTIITCQCKKETKQAYIVLTDVTGKVLQKIQVQPDVPNYRLEMGHFAKGFYHVCLIEDGKQSDCKKLIIN